jgi:hypothetical protein
MLSTLNHSTPISLKFIRVSLLLVSLEGLIAFLVLVFQPSMQRNAVLGGYSIARLFIIAAVLCMVLIFGAITLYAWKKPDRIEAMHVSFYGFLAKKDRLAWLVVLLGGMLAGLLFLVGVFILPDGKNWLETCLAQLTPQPERWMSLLSAVWSRGGVVLGWSALFCMHGLIYLRWHLLPIWQKLGRLGAWQRVAGLLTLVGLSVYHWVVLIFQLKIFLLIPGWKWYFYDKGFSLFQPLFFVLLILAGVVCWAVFHIPCRKTWKLVFVILLGYAIQVGFGFLEGGGYESLRIKYADSVFNGYALEAARQPDLADVVLHYEKNYGDDWYLGTKPPGVLLTYWGFEKISNALMPLPTAEQRFVWLTQLAAYVFPLIAMAVVVVLFIFEKELTGSEQPWAPGLLFVTLPSVILIPLYLDQVLYPLIFMSILLLLLNTMRQQSWQMAVYCGISIYFAVYFSFSLLPLIPLSGLWVVLDAIIHRDQTDLKRTAKLLAGMALGFVVTYAIFRLKLNYDLLERYVNAMAAHRRAKEFTPGIEQVLKAVWLNNAEFASFVGFPVIFLFLAKVFISLKRWIKWQPKASDGLMLALLMTYAALNLLGQTSGEVQRLWLFLTPLVVMFACQATARIFQQQKREIVGLVMELQLITALLLMRFQDFYG